MPETNFLQLWGVDHPFSKMMPKAGMLQAPIALLFPWQLTVPPQAPAVPASVRLGQGQEHPAPTGTGISITHPKHQNPPGINNNSCCAPYYCHCNVMAPETPAATGEEEAV